MRSSDRPLAAFGRRPRDAICHGRAASAAQSMLNGSHKRKVGV
jgi:hypothetical protein